MTFPADFPGAIVVEARNYGYSTDNDPKAWCLHTPEEKPDDYPGTPYYFHNTDRQASTTYFVSYYGFVYQCVPEKKGAYANAREGVPGHFDWEHPLINLNLQTLSVEVEGYAASIHQTMPRGSPQWVSLVRLMAHRCRALGIPPERTFGHKQVSVYRSDPGQLNIAALVADVKLLLEDDMPLTDADVQKIVTALQPVIVAEVAPLTSQAYLDLIAVRIAQLLDARNKAQEGVVNQP